jgi:hypothetical protein
MGCRGEETMRELFINLKYILLSIGKYTWNDMKSEYNNLSKPREVMNILFWFAMIMIFTKNWLNLKIIIVVYALVYIYKIIKKGDWMYLKREKYKSL